MSKTTPGTPWDIVFSNGVDTVQTPHLIIPNVPDLLIVKEIREYTNFEAAGRPARVIRADEWDFRISFERARNRLLSIYARLFGDGHMKNSEAILVPVKPYKPLPAGMDFVHRQKPSNNLFKSLANVDWYRFDRRMKKKIGLMIPLEPIVSYRAHNGLLEVLATFAMIFARSACDVLINRRMLKRLKSFDDYQIAEYMNFIFHLHYVRHYVEERYDDRILCCCFHCLEDSMDEKESILENIEKNNINHYPAEV